MSEDFDLSKFVTSHGKRIAVGTLPTAPKKRRRKPFVVEFVKFPQHWAEALLQSKGVATYQLALTILFEAYKRDHVGGEIVLSSTVTKMSRETRRRATNELIKFGLIGVEQNGNQAFRVTKLYHVK